MLRTGPHQGQGLVRREGKFGKRSRPQLICLSRLPRRINKHVNIHSDITQQNYRSSEKMPLYCFLLLGLDKKCRKYRFLTLFPGAFVFVLFMIEYYTIVKYTLLQPQHKPNAALARHG